MHKEGRCVSSGTQQPSPLRGSLPATEQHHIGITVKKAPANVSGAEFFLPSTADAAQGRNAAEKASAQAE
jgi:hypothetical protein